MASPLSVPMDVRKSGTNASDTNHPLGWGIIGASNIASDFVKSLRDVPGASVVSVAARSEERAAEFAELHGIPTVHTTYAQLVEDSAVHIVYVGTITTLHKVSPPRNLRAACPQSEPDPW